MSKVGVMEGMSVEFAIEAIRKAATTEQAEKLLRDLDRIHVEGSEDYNKGWKDCAGRAREVLRELGDVQ